MPNILTTTHNVKLRVYSCFEKDSGNHENNIVANKDLFLVALFA